MNKRVIFFIFLAAGVGAVIQYMIVKKALGKAGSV